MTSPTFGPAATGRIASAGRNVASVSFPRVADAGGSNAMGPQEQSVRYDDGYHPQERRERQDPQRREGQPDFFHYAEVAYLDQAFTAELTNWKSEPIMLPDAIAAGVRRYESNLRVLAGLARVGGDSYDRLH
ncbi:conserved hypothetical protein [uncultured Alphaproteobacteria bacterium]|uniref:Uncharacterized protein n=1 Tax=uncultured Alphaproteobacteria bacterium TaxID=91750 RepID=A0A212IXR5_9PROT|nr:conserved hypothetical protein [uncultured Alphaproteobacteria bacterium]